MKTIMMIGPFPEPSMGPAVRNKLTFDALCAKGYNLKKIDTTKGKSTLIYALLYNAIKSDWIFISVSKNGQFILLPIVYLISIFLVGKGKILFYPAGGKLYENILNLPIIIRKLYVCMLKRFRHIYVQTQGMKDKLNHIVNENHITVLPNPKPYRCVEIKKFDLQSDIKERRLLFLSRVRKEKGVELLIEAIKDVDKRIGVNCSLDFYGIITPDYKERFFNLISENQNVKYKNVLPSDNTLVNIINSYYVMIFPTMCVEEGFPGVLSDAALAGLPVIASNVAYNNEIIKDGVNGLLFENGNKNDLADKLYFLLKNINIRNQLAINNHECSKKYSMDMAIKEIISKIEENS